VHNVEIKPSQMGEGAGYGLFMAPSARKVSCGGKPWWKPWGSPPPHPTLASFPLSSVICAQNIGADPQVGFMWASLVRSEVLDERGVVMGYLAVERARGRDSPLAPWVDALPREFHSPLVWADSELAALRGTTLGRAVPTLRARLAAMWQEAGPGLRAVASALKAAREPTVDDLVWAHCVFWSRGQSLPVPRQAGAASQIVARDPRRAAALLDVTEALVPGLDFANHATTRPPCWWEVEVTGDAPSSSSSSGVSGVRPGRVALQLHRGARVGPGDELCISYSEAKPNEELLMLHGFVEPGAARGALDTVMIAAPVPPAGQWDELMAARMELLQSLGMRPQFFLKGSDVAGAAGSGSKAKGGASSPPSASEAVAPVPEEALESLEVFVLAPAEVQARLAGIKGAARARAEGRALGQSPPAAATEPAAPVSGAEMDVDALAAKVAAEVAALKSSPATAAKRRGAMSDAELAVAAQQAGLRMASVSTYLRLLEVALVQMEDEKQGTGPLEADEAALAAHDAGTHKLPHRAYCAAVYRAGQKRVVRAHLVGARRELERVMKVAAQLQDVITGRARQVDMSKQ